MEDGVLDRVQQEELEATLWPVVDALPGKQAAVIRMRYQEGLMLKQCGERLLRPFLPEAVEAGARRAKNGIASMTGA